MAKKVFGVQGVEGKRSTDHEYSHAVVAVPDVVRKAEHYLQWARSRSMNPEVVPVCEEEVRRAKAQAAAGVIRPRIVSFHGSEPLAQKAARGAARGVSWLQVEVRETYRIK